MVNMKQNIKNIQKIHMQKFASKLKFYFLKHKSWNFWSTSQELKRH